VFGPTWQQLFTPAEQLSGAGAAWWLVKRAELLDSLGSETSAFVYDLEAVRLAARALKRMKSLARIHYSVKANPNAHLLQVLRSEGLEFECVSRGEAERVRQLFPDLAPERILYTPNFAPRAEYAWALSAGVRITVDNTYVLAVWPQLFRGRDIFVRVDTGVGRGHHSYVRAAGTHSKFGVPLQELPELAKLARAAGAHVMGLHAHVGSGIFDVSTWNHTARLLAEAAAHFPELSVINVGGGLGVPESPDHAAVDLTRLDALLQSVRREYPQLKIWLEPGRYLVAAAGVLLTRVTQLKTKGDICFVGVATGMNSLIRPALYGSYHDIVNLTRIEQPATQLVNVVGPICESADVLGHDRLLPETREGDVLLVANAGAYGRAMSSEYNLRAPAVELFL
jgi:diaminopimelate decarboxylase/aspartate kinase